MIGALQVGPHQIRLDDDGVFRSDTAQLLADALNTGIGDDPCPPVCGGQSVELYLLGEAQKITGGHLTISQKDAPHPGTVY
jgi:hypothetical protein